MLYRCYLCLGQHAVPPRACIIYIYFVVFQPASAPALATRPCTSAILIILYYRKHRDVGQNNIIILCVCINIGNEVLLPEESRPPRRTQRVTTRLVRTGTRLCNIRHKDVVYAAA